MKARWHKVVLLVLAISLLTVLLTAWLRPREPVYQGKPLSYRLNQLDRTNRAQARTAIRKIGPKAVPFLVGKIRRDGSVGRRLYRQAWRLLPETVQRKLSPPRSRDGSVVCRIAAALSLLGPSALPQLCKALGDRDDGVRMASMDAIGNIGQGASVVVPKLVGLLNDPRPWLRDPSVFGWAGGEGDQFAKRMGAPTRALAAWALGKIGPEASSAGPDLRALLRDPDPATQLHAALALWCINRETNGAPMLSAAWPRPSDSPTCCSILTALGEMGPSAKAAAPALLRTIHNPPHYHDYTDALIDHLTWEVLVKVDPQAAAREAEGK